MLWGDSGFEVSSHNVGAQATYQKIKNGKYKPNQTKKKKKKKSTLTKMFFFFNCFNEMDENKSFCIISVGIHGWNVTFVSEIWDGSQGSKFGIIHPNGHPTLAE